MSASPKRKAQKAAASRRYYAKAADKVKEYQAEYRARAGVGPRRSRLQKLSKHGLTEQDFWGMVERQHGRCACCGADFSGDTPPCVDHCHRTGKVRGLLCRNCNVSLGLVKENLATLAQMRAYLELDRSRPVVYLIGSLRNPEVVEVAKDIRALGLACVDNWMAAGPTADDSWQSYSNATGKTYREALQSREAVNVFHFDKAYIELADAVVLLYPAGKSGHLELGYAVGRGKRGYILQEQIADRYDVMLQFAQAPLFHSKPDLLAAMREELLGGKA